MYISKELKQKTRIRWAIGGDENSRFFHAAMKTKSAENSIQGLLLNGSWSENLQLIKDAAYLHFKQQFSGPHLGRPLFISDRFKKLNQGQAISLEAPFTDSKIKNAVWLCGGGKAPRPDGFNFIFLKARDIIKADILAAVHHFEAPPPLEPVVILPSFL